MGGKGSGNLKGSSGRHPTVPGGLVRVDVRLPRRTIEQLRRRGKLSLVVRDVIEKETRMDTETKARQRVADTPELNVFEDIIFYDWPNWDEHMEWVAIAPVAEIVNWAEVIRANEAQA